MNKPIDRFSEVAAGYARYRPQYPEALYQFILSKVRRTTVAWDAGTGNGQVARVLARSFGKVYATDISAHQLAQAPAIANVQYIQTPSEQTPISDDSTDLITVAQAAHWFDIQKFSTEVRRVSKKGGVLALWGYGLFRSIPQIDMLVDDFYHHVVGPFWDPQRVHIDQMYEGFQLPFTSIDTAAFTMEEVRDIEAIAGYLGTWSAVSRFRADRRHDPLPDLIEGMEKVVGRGGGLLCTTPIFLRIWRI
jgi:ubiquinone/menaquinone biosynthesis C-methylase UbiE